MGVYRHTLIFEGPGHGSSESLYYEFPTPSTVQSALTALADVKNKRASLLGKEWQIKGERVEQVVNDAGTPVKGIGLVNKFFLPGVQAQPSCETNISLQVLFTDSTMAHKKLLFMAGCPRSLFPNADALDINQGTQPGQWASSFASWRSLITSLGAGWYSAPTDQVVNITNYTVDADTGITSYNLSPAMSWPITSKPVMVSVEFPTSRSPLDGRQLVISETPTTCSTAKPRPAGAFTVQGVMTLKGKQLIKINAPSPTGTTGSILAQNPVSRKRGRPLLVSRGRAPVVVRW